MESPRAMDYHQSCSVSTLNALRDVAKCLELEEELTKMRIAYADDGDLRSQPLNFIDILAKAPGTLCKWNL